MKVVGQLENIMGYMRELEGLCGSIWTELNKGKSFW